MTGEDPETPPPSLADRAGGALRGFGRRPRAAPEPPAAAAPELVLAAPLAPRWAGWAVAALVAAGPLLTIGGAELLRARAAAATERLEAAAAPAAAAMVRATEARGVLRGALAGPAVGPTLDALAAALPEEDRLAAVGADEQGVLTVDIATADPDRLRTALRRTRLGGLREAGQQRGDGVLLVRWQGRTG